MTYHFLKRYLQIQTPLWHKNKLIIGKPGSGKTEIINYLLENKPDIIPVAFTGTAAEHIHGYTIHRFFGIKPQIDENDEGTFYYLDKEFVEIIRKAYTLIIDEISMVNCLLLDMIDLRLRTIRGNYRLPFGGLQVMLFGDMYQLPPITLHKANLEKLYPDAHGDYNFYNATVFHTDNYFNTFTGYKLMDDFRHKDDPAFIKILDTIRIGKKYQSLLDILNRQAVPQMFYDESYQYLTEMNDKADDINKRFINQIPLQEYRVPQQIEYVNQYLRKTSIDVIYAARYIKSQLNYKLTLKEGMKVIFTKNDTRNNQWVNGTFGRVKAIVTNPMTREIEYVIVTREDNGKEIQVERDTADGIDALKGARVKVTQFPFSEGYSITIDKAQGLTLDKVYLVLDGNTRENLTYVGLSRVRALKDLRLSRKIRPSDIRVSKTTENIKSAFPIKMIRVSNGELDDEALTIQNQRLDNFLLSIKPPQVRNSEEYLK